MFWSRVQFKVSLGKAARSTARTSPNRVGEFLKPCSSQVQVSCVCLLVGLPTQRQRRAGWPLTAETEQAILEIERGEPACIAE